MSLKNHPRIFVVGNEKGGAGKTTCSMHLIVGLLEKGYNVSAIDVDCRQASLTRYLENRKKYNLKNPDKLVLTPRSFLLAESKEENKTQKQQEEQENFEKLIQSLKEESDIIVIDTPGTYSFLSNIAHSYADTVITPINDSFIDIDVMAKIDMDGDKIKVLGPSIYSQTIWEQKLAKAKRDNSSIDWVVMRNRLSSTDAINKRNVGKVLEELAKRISFRQVSGFGERVIFRELFLQGLTLLDLKKANYEKQFNLSHIAARQELRNFLEALNI